VPCVSSVARKIQHRWLHVLGHDLKRAGRVSLPATSPVSSRSSRAASPATFEAMLTQPLVIHYYDKVYYGQGIAVPGPA
jgi:hypothetical protein